MAYLKIGPTRAQYVAVKGERVVGVVVKTGRAHKVDIGTARLASLPELAFQGAIKRNKPSLQVCFTFSHSYGVFYVSLK